MKVYFKEGEGLTKEESTGVSTELKDILVQYVGNKVCTNGDTVTVEDIVEVVANEFPEFLMVVAEENWIRGYTQALQDKKSVYDASKVNNEKGDKE